MISSGDIRDILFVKANEMGIFNIYPKENLPLGEVTEERIVIIVNGQKPQTYFNKTFAYVNIDVPDLDEYGNADLVRLDELERMAQRLFEDVYGVFDGSAYRFTWDEISKNADKDLRCHYVGVRILFEVLNVK